MKRRVVVDQRRRRSLRHQGERGFALLLVFLMASAIAMMLYMQLPRQAFESERDKEQLLIDRGEQYKRAIYVYYIQNNRQYPSRIEDLESTNSHRYLRHKYVNPYTGKDEWRLIHTNGAFLTDSLVTPPPAQLTPGVTGGALAGTGPPTGGSTLSSIASATGDPNAPPAINAQVQRRPSDQALVQNSTFQTLAGNIPNSGGDPGYQPFNPAALPPITLFPNGYNAPAGNGNPNIPGQPGFNQPGVNQSAINQSLNQLNQLAGSQQGVFNPSGLNQPPGVNQQPGFNPAGLNQAPAPGITVPGTNFQVTNPGVVPPNLNNFNQPGANQAGFAGGFTPNGQPGTTQTPFGNQTSFSPPVNQGGDVPAQPFNPQVNNPNGAPGLPGAGGGANQAINLINNLLTTPRPAPAGIGPNQQASSGGGIAGVASTFKGPSIKSYGDRDKYEEWEFVFQLNQQGTGINLQAPVGPNGSGGIPSGTGALGTQNGGGAAQSSGFGPSSFGGAAGGSPFGGAPAGAPGR